MRCSYFRIYISPIYKILDNLHYFSVMLCCFCKEKKVFMSNLLVSEVITFMKYVDIQASFTVYFKYINIVLRFLQREG